MWNIYSKIGEPLILIPIGVDPPEGYSFEGTTSNPNYLSTPTTNNSCRITKLAFRNRFTQQEKIAIDLQSIDRSTDTEQLKIFRATLRVLLEDLRNSTYIDLSRADTRAGVIALETYGLLGVGRVSIILDTTPTDIELYKE